MIGSRVPLVAVCLLVVVCLLGLAVALGGCLATEPSPSAPPTASPPTSLAPTISVAPTTTVSGAPTVGPGLGVGWTLTSGGFGSADVTSAAAVLGTTIVVAGSREPVTSDGGAAAWYSTDGTNWLPADALAGAELAAIEGIAAGGGELVAVGFDYSSDDVRPAVWLSADGRTWERVDTAGLTSGDMATVAFGAAGYVCLGFDANDGTNLVWTSADGRSWSAAEPVAGVESGATINGLVAAGDTYVAFGSSGAGLAALWSSTDGRSWRAATGLDGPADSTVNDVLSGPAGFVAVGAAYLGDRARTLAWTSTDGLAWLARPAAELDGEMIDVEPFGAGYLAVGARPEADELRFHASAWVSADGITWRQLADDPTFAFARMFELLTVGSGIVAIGERAIDPAGEEVAPAVWVGVAQ